MGGVKNEIMNSDNKDLNKFIFFASEVFKRLKKVFHKKSPI